MSTSTSEADAQAASAELQFSLFAGGGEMGARMRVLDWAGTPLGSPESWPPALRMMAKFLLANRFPQLLWWGPQFCSLYNDAYIPVLGAKHPWALGRPVSEVWKEIWHVLKPLIETPFHGGPATWMEDIPLEINRCGFFEETHFTIAYSPVPDETAPSGIGGVLATVHEITDKVIGERRVHALRELGAHTAEPRSAEEACAIVGETLASFPKDIPFLLIYLLDETGKQATNTCCLGVDPKDRACPKSIELSPQADEIWPLLIAQATEEIQLVDDLELKFDAVPQGPWPEAPPKAAIVPIRSNVQHRLAGFMIAGVSSCIGFDDRYRDFLELTSTQIATMIANARAYEQERKRAEALAELDRAKTLFFSNISHELRTPLTLLLGPTEAALSSRNGALTGTDLEMVHRNELRLLKLVNTLLDFSRIEAGRVQAAYEPTDLCAYTTEVASVFRSAVEKAGLRFIVDCEPAGEPVYVDREMWEKIVLNLLSNAFKFTFEGEIAVRLRRAGAHVELSVQDTGAGIPENEMPRLFERFHRIEAARARTHEGTGIGLALVQELVRLHGGNVHVESTVGRGSTFTVSVPLGASHLAPEHLGHKPAAASESLRTDSFVEEAQRWLPDERLAPKRHLSEREVEPLLPGLAPVTAPAEAAPKDTILVADDNADMRQYLARLLGPAYEVYLAADGISAVKAAVQLRPALILTDMMMPGLDGFGVLRAVRTDAELNNTPVILLSARAGEESSVEGLNAGADDYLVKPFTAGELLARVGTHLRLAKIRRKAAEVEAHLRAEAELERQRLRELLAQAPAAIGLLRGPEHRWVYVNDLYVHVTGRKSAADFLGKTVLESLPEIEGQPVVDLLDQVYRTGEPYVGREARVELLRGPGGEPEETYFDFVYQPMRNPRGKIEGILVHCVDVTDKVNVRRMLQESHERMNKLYLASQRLAAIVESSDDAIVSKDLKGIVTSWNPCAERIFGYTAHEMIGQSILKIIPPEMHGDEPRILATIARGDRIVHFETVRVTKSGERLEVSLTISPMRDETGKIVGASKIARDITQRKQAERALRVTERLASVGRMAATVAHEINNPLEAVTNLVYLAKANASDPNVLSYLSQAEEELSRISLLTHQTLGFYRETGGARPLALDSLFAPLAVALQPRARNKAVKIEPEFRQAPEIQAVPGEIRQLVANLLTNSIDAAPAHSSIRIRIARTSFVRGNAREGVRLTIADAGPGIPGSIRAQLFEPFFTTKREVGTGLGLWICRKIVERHRGSIRLKSCTDPGKSWTAFSVFLPADAPIADEESAA